MAAILFVVLGGRKLMAMRIDPDEPDTLDEDLHRGGATVPARGTGATTPTGTQAARRPPRPVLTLLAFVGVALVALVFDKNIGFVAITAAVILAMLRPRAQGRGQADRLADRAAGRRRQHLRHDPDHRRARRSSSATGPPASAPPRSAR